MNKVKLGLVSAALGLSVVVGGIHIYNEMHRTNVDIRYASAISGGQLADFTISRLQKASSNEDINIHLVTFGGDFMVGNEIGHAIQTSRAKVTLYVGFIAASMGAFLVCQAPNVVIGTNAIIMFHMAYHQQEGDLSTTDPFDVTVKKNIDYTLAHCKGILTDADIKTIDNGGEVWLSGAEVNARMEAAKPWYVRLYNKVMH